MYPHHCFPPMRRTAPVVCPPQYRVCDSFIPQEVPFIHPIVNVNRQNLVNIPRHYFTETSTTVPGRVFNAAPGPFGGSPFGFGRPF